MRLTALVAALCLLWAALARAQAPPDELALDTLHFSVTAGYSGYALPVANAALGRSWAAQSGSDARLAWQIGRNASVVPVRIDALHRMAQALKVKVEIVSAHGYAREEDPLGHFAYYSQELLVPPSVPTTVVLAPRVCPQSSPGAPVRLLVRVYFAGAPQPAREFPLTVTQLEPYYLYSLYLDGPADSIYSDPVNKDNRLRLALGGTPPVEDGFFESANFTLTIDHSWLTALPLAARDFAFIFADYRQVCRWPEAEQAALAAFVIGGGHLCLFNAPPTAWRGLPLGRGAQEAGRGRLLPVAGGFNQARAAAAAWLEGEIEELVLWLGGSSAGRNLESLGAFNLGQLLRLNLDFARTDPQAPFISRRQGYLNPVWLYRETCLAGMVEPWDYPEFVLDAQDVARNNANLRLFRNQGETVPLQPLANLAQARRSVLPGAAVVLALLALATVLAAAPRRWRAWPLAAAAVLLGLAGAVWWQAKPPPPQARRLVLVDGDLRCRETAQRVVLGAQLTRAGDAAAPLPPQPLVRRLSVSSPGPWQVGQDRDGARFSCWSGRGYLSLCADAAGGAAGDWPVDVKVSFLPAGRVRLQVDTTSMAPGRPCYLLSPAGWLQLPCTGQTAYADFELQPAQVRPGLARIQSLARAQPWQTGLELPLLMITFENRLVLQDLLRNPWEGGQDRALEQLCWSALLQQPQDYRAALGNQALLFAALPGADSGELRFLRLAIPLGGGV